MADLACPICGHTAPYPKNREALVALGWVTLAIIYYDARWGFTVCSFQCASRLLAQGPHRLGGVDPSYKGSALVPEHKPARKRIG